MTREEEIRQAGLADGEKYWLAGSPGIEKKLIKRTPLEMFICGAKWADVNPVNPWHKASEELPIYEVVVLVAYDGSTMDCCFNHRSGNPEAKTTQHDWCDVGYEGEPTHWMYVPDIPKEK